MNKTNGILFKYALNYKTPSLRYRFLSTSKLLKNASATTLSSDTDQVTPKKTTLYDLHVQHKGKLVDFAGYLLPVQYNNLSISASHLHTRNHASIFDVSHMLQTYVHGKDAIECFESICTADIKSLAPNSGTLTVFTNELGGILDDLIVTKVSNDLLYVVSNAACRKQDTAIIQESVVGRSFKIISLKYCHLKLMGICFCFRMFSILNVFFFDFWFRIVSNNMEKMSRLNSLTATIEH